MVTRRGFLTDAGVLAAGSTLVACTTGAGADNGGDGTSTSIDGASLATRAVPFDGVHQAGIATPHQAGLNLVAFTIRPGPGWTATASSV